ncbi:DUF4377 domain-containing protein [uncultured Alistipes sp.]|jgi:hypothetical protein|uniref:DUF4377 domain-containing protein n=1 Tax=Alistipes sp. TaxID=1872444 RepID=UPI00266CB22E|nr:DUF4377 domain-containing protein [uncultured Alistipes sp.]
MKTRIFGIFLLALTALLPAGCDKDDDATIVRLTIASVKPVTNEYTIRYLPFMTPPLYIYKESGDEWKIWPSINPISGFDTIYQEGTEYIIEVIKTYSEEVAEDQPRYSYRLHRVVSAQEKESENIPEIYLIPDPEID